jgi:homoserine kinase
MKSQFEISRLLKHTYAKVFSSASISNVGPGFDCFGFAINNLGDVIEVFVNDSKKVRIKKITGDKGRLSKNADENTASVAVQSLLKAIDADFGIDMIIHKKMPFSSGLGSSAASAVGGAFAVNALLVNKLPNEELILHALEGEKIASGNSMHADNVGPALYGGFVLARSIFPVDIIKIPFPEKLFCLVIFPHVEIRTDYARRILPKSISRDDAVKQSSNTASLIAGIMMNDFSLISRSMVDHIAEPVRSKLIPFYVELKSFMLTNGAMNFNISGSGPALFSFFNDGEVLRRTNLKLKKLLKSVDVKTTVFITDVNNPGPRLLKIL